MEKNSQISQKILAIETSGKTLSVALGERFPQKDFVLRGNIFFDIGLRHSEILKDTSAFLLQKVSWKKEDLNFIAVSTGPGSFTGLRVGISFARAIAQILEIPLIGVPTFEVLAKGIEHEQYPLCVLIDSIGDEVFAGFFDADKIRPKEPYRIFPIADLCKKLKTYSKIVCAGDGWIRYKNEIEKSAGRCLVNSHSCGSSPQARHLAKIALEKNKKLRKDSWKKVVPFYLRPPIAVERRNYSRRKA